jgi:O-antigen ligase
MNFNLKLGWLSKAEIFSLASLLLFLPSLEAPKNLFLILFLSFSFLRQLYQKLFFKCSKNDFVFISLILSALISYYFGGISIDSHTKGIGATLSYLFVGFFLSRANYSKKTIKSLFLIAVLGVIPPLVFGLLDLYSLLDYSIFKHKTTLELYSVGFVNHTAIYLCLIFGATFSLLLSIPNNNNKLLIISLFIFTCILFVAILITASRAAFLETIVCILFLILFLKNNRKLAFFVSFAALLLPLVFNAAVVQKNMEKIQSHDILANRGHVWNIAFEAIHFYPILGVGIERWSSITPEMIKESLKNQDRTYDSNDYLFAPHVHNIYLSFLIERGIIGFLCLITFLFFWCYELFKYHKKIKVDMQFKYIWAASASSFIVVFLIGFFNTTMHHEHGIMSMFFLSLFLMYKRLYLK